MARSANTGSHSSYIEEASPLLKFLDKQSGVRYSLNIITPMKGPAVIKRLRIDEIPSGFKLAIRGPKVHQIVFVYCELERKESLRLELQEVFVGKRMLRRAG